MNGRVAGADDACQCCCSPIGEQDVRIPNAETVKALQQAQAGSDFVEYQTSEDLKGRWLFWLEEGADSQISHQAG